MADRFFASYEDEFNPRPNAARGPSPVLQNGAGAPLAQRGHWPEQYAPQQYAPEPHWPADPYDHDGYDTAPQQPMFAPLDRRAVQGQSYPAQSRPERGSYDPPYPEDMRAYPAPRDGRSQDTSYSAYHSPARGFALQGDRIAKITQWAGSVCSVFVLLGAVYWAYELAVRDARGIPVVRAAEGPLRIAPTTPGGEISANQGLAVNAIAAKGGSETLPDVVTLAPAPLQLAQEDVATTTSAEAPPALETATPETATPETATLEDTDGAQLASTETLSAPEGTGSALADLAAKTPDVMPISDEAAVEAALAMALSDGNEPVSKSNTDAAQPAELANLDAAQETAPYTEITAPPTSEVDPATIPAGTNLVQLGAFDDEQTARAAWATLQTQFTDLIGTKALVVQQATSGGRVFFRLRAHGFADDNETRRFCAALLAENASCIPVSQR